MPKGTKTLLKPARLGPNTLKNRVVMAPLTRNRAGEGNVPQAMNAEYYAQRASAGLIITEGSQVSPQGIGYPGTPGIRTASFRWPLRPSGPGARFSPKRG